MRLLLACAYDPSNAVHGQGVIIGNTLAVTANEAQDQLPMEIGVALFRDGAHYRQSPEVQSQRVELRQPGRRLDRKAMLRTYFRLPLSGEERTYLSQVAEIAHRYDAVLWFGSPYDPVSREIAHHVGRPVIYHVSDSISLHEERRPGWSSFLKREVATRIEKDMVRRGGFAAVIYVGAADAARGRSFLTPATKPAILHLPLGVDVVRFRPQVRPPGARKTLLFAGSMCYAPNIDAAKRLVADILPLTRSGPSVRIVGHSPTKEVLALTEIGRPGSVTVTGWVEDIGAEYSQADVLVAPVELGAGMQNKVIEALASGIPVVTSPLVAAGIGQELPGLFVCRSPAEYAGQIDQLLTNDQLRKTAGDAGRKFMVDSYTWVQRTRRLKEVIVNGLGTNIFKPAT
jgi:glycosyltransferase involved in cell wall biosynthesis